MPIFSQHYFGLDLSGPLEYWTFGKLDNLNTGLLDYCNTRLNDDFALHRGTIRTCYNTSDAALSV